MSSPPSALRQSQGALALIRRRGPRGSEYLLQWNEGWKALSFVGGHLEPGESFRDALRRELAEELHLDPEHDCRLAAEPIHLEYTAYSRGAGQDTAYTMELFDVELSAPAVELIARDPANAWVGVEEVRAGRARDGRRVSDTVLLLLEKAGVVPALWLERRIFVSSTFKDFHAERDFLHNEWLPLLHDELRQRGLRVHVELVDLRQGVDTMSVVQPGEALSPALVSERKELLVLKYCLDEVQRTRPFFVGLLGDRYGWVAPLERSRPVAAEKQLAIPDEELARTSVTALELEYGLLASAERSGRCHVYVRQPLPYDAMPPEQAALYSDSWRARQLRAQGEEGRADEAEDAARRLEALKRRLADHLPGRFHTYRATWDGQRLTGLGAWGEQLLADVLADLEEEYRDLMARPAPTPLEEFIAHRRRGFVGRDDQLGEALALACDPGGEGKGWGLCLTGEPGAGKSSFFAELAHRLQGEKGVLLLAHAAGSEPGSERVGALLRRWVGELAASLKVPPPLTDASTEEDAEQAFASLLGRASATRRVVVLVDALDQLERSPRAQHLSWLPPLWPANARLIATTIPGVPSQALAQRPGTLVQALRPLDQQKEAVAIAERFYYQQLGGSLNPVVRALLLGHSGPGGTPAAGNPLWLRLAIDELTALDADDFTRFERELSRPLEEREGALLRQLGLAGELPATLGGLDGEKRHYLMLLDFVSGLPGDVAGLYQRMLERAEEVAGEGLTRGFACVMGLSRFGWRESDLRALLPLVAQADGLPADEWEQTWPVRFARLRRCFRAHLVRRGALGQWDFFHAQTRRAVLDRYLGGAELRQEVHNLMTAHLLLLDRGDSLHENETLFHMIHADNRRLAAEYLGAVLTEGERAAAARALVDHILDDDRGGNANLSWVLSLLADPGLDGEPLHRVVSTLLFQVTAGLEGSLPLAGQLEILRVAHRVLTNLTAREPSQTVWQRDLSVSQSKIGDLLLAGGDSAGALVAYRESLAIRERLATRQPDDLNWQYGLSMVHARISEILWMQGELKGARAANDAGHLILERLTAHDPANAAWQRAWSAELSLRGHLLRAQGDRDGALRAFREDLAIASRLAQENPADTDAQRDLSVSHVQLGDILKAKGDLAGALEAYRAALAIRERLGALDPTRSAWQRDLSVNHERIAHVLKEQGRLADALANYRTALAIAQRLVGRDPGNATWQRDLSVSHVQIGDILEAKGDLAGALAEFKAALAIRQRLVERDPANVIGQDDVLATHNRIAKVLAVGGDADGALAAYRAALEVSQTLLARDPANGQRQHGVAISYFNLAATLEAKGDLRGAFDVYQKYRSIMEHLVDQEPRNVTWNRDLVVAYYRLAGLFHMACDFEVAHAYFTRCLARLRVMRGMEFPLDPMMADLLERLEGH